MVQKTHRHMCVAAVVSESPSLLSSALTCMGVLQTTPQEEGDQEQHLQWGHGAWSLGEGLCVWVPLLTGDKRGGDLFNLFGDLAPPPTPHTLPAAPIHIHPSLDQGCLKNLIQ